VSVYYQDAWEAVHGDAPGIPSRPTTVYVRTPGGRDQGDASTM
jgi:hypothetical protein